MSQDAQSFEQQLSQLESLVQRLESGQLSLEESLQAYEQGVRLTRACQQQLEQAQLRVQRAQENPVQGDTL